MSLAKLTEKLLYNSIIEVWIALCEDYKEDWKSPDLFNSYMNFIKSNTFDIQSLGVCPSGTGLKEQYEKCESCVLRCVFRSNQKYNNINCILRILKKTLL